MSEGSTFVNVEHGNNWGNVYSSNSFYNDFVLSLKHNPRGWGPGTTEFRGVEGLEGIYLASVYTDITESNSVGKRKQTKISYDKGPHSHLSPFCPLLLIHFLHFCDSFSVSFLLCFQWPTHFSSSSFYIFLYHRLS